MTLSFDRLAPSADTLPDPASLDRLALQAQAVLLDNRRGNSTIPAPQLYPHQWSWDSAFIAIGTARFDVPMAVAEMRALLQAQWSTGMIPHVVFSDAPGYFPGPDVWRTHELPTIPQGQRTSGICQPPAHALALAAILDAGRAAGGSDEDLAVQFVTEALPAVAKWHEWLVQRRGHGMIASLIEIHHGWESGMDNSPRWDRPYARVAPYKAMEFTRLDNQIVEHAEDRPTDVEYERYLAVVAQLRATGYRDSPGVFDALSFRVGDVFLTALLALAAGQLARVAREVGREDIASRADEHVERARSVIVRSLDPSTGLARDFDIWGDSWLRVESVASFALLISGGPGKQFRRQLDLLVGQDWMGHHRMALPVVPTVSPAHPGFHPRQYWRGPSWPVINWLFSYALRVHGATAEADALRAAGLSQVADGSFAEYYDPVSGNGAGSPCQSWTAAAAVDWIAGVRD